MRERPILFSGEMVRAILAGTKTQTRRVVRPQPDDFVGGPGVTLDDGSAAPLVPVRMRESDGGLAAIECPYGKPDDRLWVRETFYCDDYRYPRDIPADELGDAEWRERMLYYRADVPSGRFEDAGYWGEPGSAWKPAIHMPRWASRIVLEVTDVRVERLQAITPEDVAAEGATILVAPDTRGVLVPVSRWEEWEATEKRAADAIRLQFADLWDGINGKRAPWSSDPWVWVVSFRGVQP